MIVIIYKYLYIYFNYIYRHIDSNQVITANIVYEIGKRRMPQESKLLKTLSELMGVSWCMFIWARLLNRVSFVVLRRYVFNLRKQLKELSAVAVESSEVQKRWCECSGTNLLLKNLWKKQIRLQSTN